MGKTVLLIVLILFILFCIGGFINSLKRNKVKKPYRAEKEYVWRHSHGIPHVPKNALSTVYLTTEKLIIECDKKVFQLPLESIAAVEYMTKSDLLKKDKTVIGRGVVGGIILGPLGAVVGGMSGIGEKNAKGKYLVLNYRSSEDGEIKVIIFNVNFSVEAKELASKLTERIVTNKMVDGTLTL